MYSLALMVFSTVVIACLAIRTIQSLRKYKYVPAGEEPDLNDSASVSVCVAARNETHALAQSLERVLKSDHKKLEILVLDDSSVDDTSLIIKSFASAGVRFIAGSALPDGWLGKNHAYQTLLEEASGDFVLFMDVDTTMRIGTIRQLVRYAQRSGHSMVSVLPRRDDSYRASAIVGTMRYYWELILSKSDHPPASSALWMVRRSALLEAKVGLSDFRSSVRPERHIAHMFNRNDDYSYVIGTQQLGIGFEKRLRSQYDTAVRLYYPLVGKSLFRAAATLVLLLSLLSPVYALAVPQWSMSPLLTFWSIILYAIVSLTLWYFTKRSYASISRQLRVILWPLLLVQEVILLIASSVLYSIGKVSWKGRSVNDGPDHIEALKIDD